MVESRAVCAILAIMETLTRQQILVEPPGVRLNALVEEQVFGHTGIGYYGPPAEAPWTHVRSVWHESYEEARTAYRAYHTRVHGSGARGIVDPDEFDPALCWWQDGWGSRTVGDYSEDIAEAWIVVSHVQRWNYSARCQFFDELQSLASTPSGNVYWPDVLTALADRMPWAICVAALLTVLTLAT